MASLAKYAACDASRHEVLCEVIRALDWSFGAWEIASVQQKIEEYLGPFWTPEREETVLDDALRWTVKLLQFAQQNGVIQKILQRFVWWGRAVDALEIALSSLLLAREVVRVYKLNRLLVDALACRGGGF